MKFKGLFILSIAAFSISCTRKTETTLRVQTPLGPAPLSAQNISTQSVGWNTSLNPSSLSEFNCYGVFVGGNDPMMNQYSCSYGGALKFRFGRQKFFVPAGQAIDIDVPSGPSRKIILVGFKTQNSACHLMSPGEDPNGNDMSEPHVLGVVERSLSPGVTTIDITRVFDNTNKFDECDFGNGGNNYQQQYGSGLYGNETLNIGSTLNLNTTTGTLGKKLTYHQRVMAIDPTTGSVLNLVSSPTASELSPNDEIMWIVNTAADITGDNGGPDIVCGGNLHRGSYGFTKVVSVTGSTVVVTYPISNSPGTLNLTAIAENNANSYSGNDFCRIQIIKVPHYANLTLTPTSPGSALVVNNYNFDNAGAGEGGILAMRVQNNLTISNSNPANYIFIDVAGGGYSGGAAGYPGTGMSGIGQYNVTSANENGGGAAISAFYGGGGSLVGIGGFAASGGTPGFVINYCLSGATCRAGEKPLFGGGGGTGLSGSAGNGGGIVMIFAKNIITSSGGGTTYIKAHGQSATGYGGGGAGGSILIRSSSIVGADPLNLYANGGNAANASGAAGGGGAIEIHTCTTPAVALTTDVSTGATGASGGSGRFDPNYSNPSTCY